MKRTTIIALLLAAALLLCLPAAALTYPEKTGSVADSTGLISASLRQDIETLSTRTQAAYGGSAYLYVTHFLGGTSVSEFAQSLFERWALGEKDFLLVMVIGEETSSLKLGGKLLSALPGDTGDTVMASHFRRKYADRAYGEAVSSLFEELSSRAAVAFRADLDLSGLFSAAPAVQQTADWSDFITSGNVDWLDYGLSHTAKPALAGKKSGGLNTGSFVAIAVIVWFLFFRRKRRG